MREPLKQPPSPFSGAMDEDAERSIAPEESTGAAASHPTAAAPAASSPTRITDRRVIPPGVMPKHLQQWAILGIAVVMMGILSLAGPPKTVRPATTAPAVLAVDPNGQRIEDYQRRVQEQAQRLAAEQAQLELTKSALASSLGTTGTTSAAPGRQEQEPVRYSPSSGSAEQRETNAERGRVADNVAYSRPSSSGGSAPAGVANGSVGAPGVQLPPMTLPPGFPSFPPLGAPTSPAAMPASVADGTAAPLPRPASEPTAGDAPEARPASARDATRGTRSASAVAPGRQSSIDVVRLRVSEGTVIDTVLTNRLDGTFKGPVNALVSVPVYAGDQLVIPAGARVLGEATPVTTFGQRRLAVAFHRILLPSGERIDLDAFPGLEQAGDLGLTDIVDRHYGEMFGASVALGILAGFTGGQTSVGLTATADEHLRQGMAAGLGQSGTHMLDHFLNLLPTVTIREGHRIKVYLTRDLELPAYRPAFAVAGGRP